jgi:hypothetical protein
VGTFAAVEDDVVRLLVVNVRLRLRSRLPCTRRVVRDRRCGSNRIEEVPVDAAVHLPAWPAGDGGRR